MSEHSAVSRRAVKNQCASGSHLNLKYVLVISIIFFVVVVAESAAREPRFLCGFEVELICLRYSYKREAVKNDDALTDLSRWVMGSKKITLPPGCDGVSLQNLLYT